MPKTPQTGAPLLSMSTHEDLARRGALALKLINTETLDRGKPRDGLPSPDALAQWWETARTRYPDQCAIAGAGKPIAWTNDLLDGVKALRMALRTLFTHLVDKQSLEEEDLKLVNAILALGYVAIERTDDGNVKTVMRLRDPEQGSVLVPIARSALQLLTEGDRRRLHQCKHDRCIVFFYDTTKSGTRRWCSPGCMNRARSIQHYHLTKKAAARES
jgi:predicted RNA-binding Zn ribbon-like protein